MIEAEKLTIYDYETDDALFEYIKDEGQFNEVKELLETGLSVKPIVRGLRETCLHFENIGK